MKRNRVCIVFIIWIFIAMIGTILNIGMKTINPRQIDTEAAIESIDVPNTIGNAGKQANVFDSLKTGISTIETKFSNNMLLKLNIIDINGLIQRLLNKYVVNDASLDNAVIKSSDGILHFISQDLDVSDYCNNVTELNRYCSSQNIPLLYVLAPPKVIDGYTKLPTGIVDHSNNIADQMDKLLNQNNVRVMDLRKIAELDHLNKEDMFYITDHHWTYNTAFWAFTKIVGELNTNHGFNITNQYIDLTNYRTDIYGKWFLGSEGMRVGKYYAGIDDFYIIIPNFSTNMEVRHSLGHDQYVTKIGNFNETIISQRILDKKYGDLYHAYFSENYQETIVKNKSSTIDNKKILILKDSYGLPVSAFLSLTCLETRLLDLRAYSSFDLYGYINNYKPDIVMFIYNPAFNNPKKFVFKKEPKRNDT